MERSTTTARNGRTGDVASMIRVVRTAKPTPVSISTMRRILADFCRLLEPDSDLKRDGWATPTASPRANLSTPVDCLIRLSPRMRQTLERLLTGDQEKQVARHLGLSRNTVHVYVKAIYRQFGVNSRAELMSHFLRHDTSPTP